MVKAGGGIMPFFPVIDGELIHQRPLEAIAAGAAAGVELLTGITSDEFQLFSVPSGLAASITAEALPVLLARQGWIRRSRRHTPRTVPASRRARSSQRSPSDAFFN